MTLDERTALENSSLADLKVSRPDIDGLRLLNDNQRKLIHDIIEKYREQLPDFVGRLVFLSMNDPRYCGLALYAENAVVLREDLQTILNNKNMKYHSVESILIHEIFHHEDWREATYNTEGELTHASDYAASLFPEGVVYEEVIKARQSSPLLHEWFAYPMDYLIDKDRGARELYVQLRALEVLYPKEFNELLPETAKLKAQNYRTNDRGVVENQPVPDTTRSGETSGTANEKTDTSGTIEGESSTRDTSVPLQRDAEEALNKSDDTVIQRAQDTDYASVSFDEPSAPSKKYLTVPSTLPKKTATTSREEDQAPAQVADGEQQAHDAPLEETPKEDALIRNLSIYDNMTEGDINAVDYRSRNVIADFTYQDPGSEKEGTLRPLVIVKNFLSSAYMKSGEYTKRARDICFRPST